MCVAWMVPSQSQGKFYFLFSLSVNMSELTGVMCSHNKYTQLPICLGHSYRPNH